MTAYGVRTLAALVAALCALVAVWWWLRSGGVTVPRADRSSCIVKRGDRMNGVLAACGRACGRGDVPKGECGSGYGGRELVKLCGNTCDVHSDTAVCYASDEVVAIHRIPATGLVAERCSW